MNNNKNELEDFSELVPVWKPATLKENLLAFGFLVLFVVVFAVLLYASSHASV